MFDLYTWSTPNGHKLHIMLEETGLEYRLHQVNIAAGEQFDPEFLRISPNNKIPAMIDQDGPNGQQLAMFESGAMLIYLAGKSGRLLPQETQPRMVVLQWLMFQMAHIGPMLGQAHHFRKYARESVSYAVERYTNEANRLYGVLDRRLGESPYIGGADYSIADIATFPWLRSPEDQGVTLGNYPHVQRWFEAIDARPAVQRGLRVLADRPVDSADDRTWDILFGSSQFRHRQ